MIVYKTTKTFSTAALKDFLNALDSDMPVNRFENALFHSSHVFSAWDDNRLIGLLSALDDTMNVFVTFFMYNPQYASEENIKILLDLFEQQYPSHKKAIVAYRPCEWLRRFGYYADDATCVVKNDLPGRDIISLREARNELETGTRDE